MNQRAAWSLVGLVILAALGVGLYAQRPSAPEDVPGERARPERRPDGPLGRFLGGPPGRYQVVHVDGRGPDASFVVLDTVTGDLFRAGRDDVKPYHDRPRTGPGGEPGRRPDGDGDRPRIRERPRDRGETEVKDRPRERPRDRVNPRDRDEAKDKDRPRDTPRDRDRPQERDRSPDQDRE